MDMKFDFISRRKWWYLLSALLLLPGLISIAIQGFNLGIDFTGGTLLDLQFTRPVTVAEVRDALKTHNLENSTIQLATNTQVEAAPNILIRTHVLTEAERLDAMNGLQEKLGDFEVLRIEKVGAVIGAELAQQAIFALLAAAGLMLLYITYRFEFTFAAAAILSLMHDALFLLGFFSLLRLEIDSSFIAAVLTVIGYSINDTIVIFDRIRENLKTFAKGDSIEALTNRSIWQTMTRSIYTVLTVLFATVSLYLFGGETTKNFSLAMTVGFTMGVYSSLCNAAPMWVEFRHYADRRKREIRMRGRKS